jgi:hypothetical protein
LPDFTTAAQPNAASYLDSCYPRTQPRKLGSCYKVPMNYQL